MNNFNWNIQQQKWHKKRNYDVYIDVLWLDKIICNAWLTVRVSRTDWTLYSSDVVNDTLQLLVVIWIADLTNKKSCILHTFELRFNGNRSINVWIELYLQFKINQFYILTKANQVPCNGLFICTNKFVSVRLNTLVIKSWRVVIYKSGNDSFRGAING